MKEFALSLSMYGDVRKMNYEELSKWAADLYRKGYKAGKSSVTAAEAFSSALRSVLLRAEDIGPVRTEAVAKTLARALNEPIGDKK